MVLNANNDDSMLSGSILLWIYYKCSRSNFFIYCSIFLISRLCWISDTALIAAEPWFITPPIIRIVLSNVYYLCWFYISYSTSGRISSRSYSLISSDIAIAELTNCYCYTSYCCCYASCYCWAGSICYSYCSFESSVY